MKPLTHQIILNEFDRTRLINLLQVMRVRSGVNAWNLDALEHELRRAEVLRMEEVPPDVITMNSQVRLRDLESGQCLSVTLVFPDARLGDSSAVPVLSPLGLALLGCRVGHVLAWDTAEGRKQVRVDAVIYQPEAAGNACL